MKRKTGRYRFIILFWFRRSFLSLLFMYHQFYIFFPFFFFFFSYYYYYLFVQYKWLESFSVIWFLSNPSFPASPFLCSSLPGRGIIGVCRDLDSADWNVCGRNWRRREASPWQRRHASICVFRILSNELMNDLKGRKWRRATRQFPADVSATRALVTPN